MIKTLKMYVCELLKSQIGTLGSSYEGNAILAYLLRHRDRAPVSVIWRRTLEWCLVDLPPSINCYVPEIEHQVRANCLVGVTSNK